MNASSRILLLVPLLFAPSAHAYIGGPPASLGMMCSWSTHVAIVEVARIDKEKNVIFYRKLRDVKGKWPNEFMKHVVPAGFADRNLIFNWAEPGKQTVICALESYKWSHTYIDRHWYASVTGDWQWWNVSHSEPILLRTYCGRPERLIGAVGSILASKEVVVPCMVGDDQAALATKKAKVQRVRASLKLLDYNPKRDFAGWGSDDFLPLAGMPGFIQSAPLGRTGAETQAISAADLDGDGRMDLCLFGAGKLTLLQNGGDHFNEVLLPSLIGGARAAVWADYNGDGKPDLLLATAEGPKLYTNLGGTFRDDSHLLPQELAWNLTSAAWIDHDGDGKPDILLANGYHGLRLYRNVGSQENPQGTVKLGEWSYLGPFDNTNGKGFDTVYPPEEKLNLTAPHKGKNNLAIAWRQGRFPDGQVNNLALLPDNNNAVMYLHREIECVAPFDLPVSLGSDDALVLWLNGQKLLSENVTRVCAADQNRVILKLKAGKNSLLLKSCKGTGAWSFIFQPLLKAPPAITWKFEDVSDAVGLGVKGIGSQVKGDTLTVADVNSDGKPDFLYGAGTGILVLNTGKGFEEAKDHGIVYKPGRVGPVFCDFDGDGHLDLFIPQNGVCKLFKNDGKGKFTDVTAQAGDLAKPVGMATCAAWGDFDNDGKPDLVIGCLKGPNRFFRNKGDGTFENMTEAVGLERRIYNTQAISLVDINGDGILDLVFNNEGQESCVLLGNPDWGQKTTPLTVLVKGKEGVLGSKVRVTDSDGKVHGSHVVSGGDGRGGQAAPFARFALKPGTYKVEVLYSTGIRRMKEITVANVPARGVIDETALIPQ